MSNLNSRSETLTQTLTKVEKRLMILTTLFITGIVVSNVIAAKVVKVYLFIFPASIISYTFTFILSNIASEVLGKKYSKLMIFMGFLAQAAASGLIILGLFLPSLSSDKQEAYKVILGMNWRFTLASLSAYSASQGINHYIFNKRLFKNALSANLFSVVVAQLIDTIVFTFIAFLGVYENLWSMIFSQYIIKIILVLVVNPIFLVTKKLKG